MLCSTTDRYQCFRDTYSVHLTALWKWRQHIQLHKISDRLGELISDAASSLHANCKSYWIVVSTQAVFFSFTQIIDVYSCLQTWHKFYLSWFQNHQELQRQFQKCEGMTLISNALKHTESVHSSFSIVTCCRLNDPGFKPRWGWDFLGLSRPAHPASCTMGSGSLSQGYSHWCVGLNLLAPGSSNRTATPPLSLCACLAHNRTAFNLSFQNQYMRVLFLKLPDVTYCSYETHVCASPVAPWVKRCYLVSVWQQVFDWDPQTQTFLVRNSTEKLESYCQQCLFSSLK